MRAVHVRLAVYLLAGLLLAGCGGGGGGSGAAGESGPSTRTYTFYLTGAGGPDGGQITLVETLTLRANSWDITMDDPPASIGGALETLPHGVLRLAYDTSGGEGGGLQYLYGLELPHAMAILFVASGPEPQSNPIVANDLVAVNEEGTCPVDGSGQNLVAWPSPTFDQLNQGAFGYTSFQAGTPQQYSELQLALASSLPPNPELGFVPVESCDQGIVSMGGWGTQRRSMAGLAQRTDGQGLNWIATPQPVQWPNLAPLAAMGRSYVGILTVPSCGTDPKLCQNTKATVFLTASGDATGLQLSAISNFDTGATSPMNLSVLLGYSDGTGRSGVVAPPGLLDQGALALGEMRWKLVATLHTIDGKAVLIGIANTTSNGFDPTPKDWAMLVLREK